jgi:NAD(P)H-dependent flavin oxidoreductase YrpB (nitropropane dioxygenase family)
MSTISTRFTDTYGVTHPIAQAGMAFVGMTPDLAVAVCEAGGLGALGVGLMPPPALKTTIDGVRAGTDRPFNVNFVTGLTETPQIEVACVAGVAVASFHWGHPPRAWIDALQSGAHPAYKARLVAAQGTDTVRTHVFGRQWPAEHDDGPVRVLRNEVVARMVTDAASAIRGARLRTD